jgi:hypothetical protein
LANAIHTFTTSSLSSSNIELSSKCSRIAGAIVQW